MGCHKCTCHLVQEELRVNEGIKLEGSCPCGHLVGDHETAAELRTRCEAHLTRLRLKLEELEKLPQQQHHKKSTFSKAGTSDVKIVEDYFGFSCTLLEPLCGKRKNEDETPLFDWSIDGKGPEDEIKRTPAAMEALTKLFEEHLVDFAASYELVDARKQTGLFQLKVPDHITLDGGADVLLVDKRTRQTLAVIELNTTKSSDDFDSNNARLLCELYAGSFLWTQALVVLDTDLNSRWKVGCFSALDCVELQPYENWNGAAAIEHFLSLIQTRGERNFIADPRAKEGGGSSNSSNNNGGNSVGHGSESRSSNKGQQVSTGPARDLGAYPMSVAMEQDLEGCLPEGEVQAHEQLLLVMRFKRRLEEELHEEVTIPRWFLQNLAEMEAGGSVTK